MIITNDDLGAFERQYEKYLNDLNQLDDLYQHNLYKWILKNPHIVLATNFADYTAVNEIGVTRELIEDNRLSLSFDQPLFRDLNRRWLYPWDFGSAHDEKWGWIDINSFKEMLKQESYKYLHNIDIFSINVNHITEYLKGFRDSYLYEFLKNIPKDYLKEVVELRDSGIKEDEDYISGKQEHILSYEEIYQQLKKYVNKPLKDKKFLMSSNWYIPKHREIEYIRLKAVTQNLLANIQEHKLTLNDITWTDLENIVAVLFQNEGYEVFLKENPQGGRDIVGRKNMEHDYEYIAIEVKHWKYKNIGYRVLSELIQKNTQYNTLCIATSRNFSTTVIKESKRPENIKRIELWDGERINNLIRVYKI